MTAHRVVDQHSELTDISGTLTHEHIDLYIDEILTQLSGATGGFASGSSDPFASYVVVNPTGSLPFARQVITGAGIIVTDDFANRTLTFAVDPTYVFSFMVWNEVPSGSVDGNNFSFATAFVPVSGSLMLFENGLLQRINHDYTLSGGNISFLQFPPRSGSNLLVTYQK